MSETKAIAWPLKQSGDGLYETGQCTIRIADCLTTAVATELVQSANAGHAAETTIATLAARVEKAERHLADSRATVKDVQRNMEDRVSQLRGLLANQEITISAKNERIAELTTRANEAVRRLAATTPNAADPRYSEIVEALRAAPCERHTLRIGRDGLLTLTEPTGSAVYRSSSIFDVMHELRLAAAPSLAADLNAVRKLVANFGKDADFSRFARIAKACEVNQKGKS